tara:strand:+ start:640 stop:1365 length:726 start_codon:yes stop_codon:yes gene_type:complete
VILPIYAGRISYTEEEIQVTTEGAAHIIFFSPYAIPYQYLHGNSYKKPLSGSSFRNAWRNNICVCERRVPDTSEPKKRRRMKIIQEDWSFHVPSCTIEYIDDKPIVLVAMESRKERKYLSQNYPRRQPEEVKEASMREARILAEEFGTKIFCLEEVVLQPDKDEESGCGGDTEEDGEARRKRNECTRSELFQYLKVNIGEKVSQRERRVQLLEDKKKRKSRITDWLMYPHFSFGTKTEGVS